MTSFDTFFPRYRQFDPQVPVWCVTPEQTGCFHRFFDTSPISPSGRYLAATRLADESRMPAPDQTAELVVIDLSDGSAAVIAKSGCFDAQLGVQAQWGASDDDLFFNDLDWSSGKPEPHAVRYRMSDGGRTDLEGPVYMVSPDGRTLASPCLLRTALTQPGYGAVVLPTQIPYNNGASETDGIYLTDVETGRKRLFLSFAEIVDQIGDELEAAFRNAGSSLAERDIYGFHVKWNPEGSRLLFVARARSGDQHARLLNFVITVEIASKRVSLAMPPDLWSRGGHHPQWHPDGEQIIMNLKYPEDEMRFVRYPATGGTPEVIADPVHGGGHPSLHPAGRYLLTDEYEHGPLAYPDGTTPIRFVDTKTSTVREIARIRTRPDYHGRGRELRVDPHPAWDSSFRYAVFNACPEGYRQLFLIDLAPVMTEA